MITLFQYNRIGNLPSFSPFCMKVENFLRMYELKYDNHFIDDPRKAPKGKLPYIEFQGELIADSSYILAFLKQKTGNMLDKDLSDDQKAMAVLIEDCFGEHLYWLMVYMRWQDDAGWRSIKDVYFGHLPFIKRCFLPALIRKQTLKALYAQGTGRHIREEVLDRGHQSLHAMATILKDKKYFLGESMSSVDATAFAFLANFLWSPRTEDPWTKYILKHENLVAYCERMWGLLYPEMRCNGSLRSEEKSSSGIF